MRGFIQIYSVLFSFIQKRRMGKGGGDTDTRREKKKEGRSIDWSDVKLVIETELRQT